jgi:hypothetical protein
MTKLMASRRRLPEQEKRDQQRQKAGRCKNTTHEEQTRGKHRMPTFYASTDAGVNDLPTL